VGVDADRGLDPDEVQRRLSEFGRNEIATEPPPTLWELAKAQLANPMNIMLLIVSIASFAIGQVATGALQRLLDTVQLTGAQWVLVIALSLVAPAFTAIDKAIQLHRLNTSPHDA
jgi:magnesium-transporting ATPase (P-type)